MSSRKIEERNEKIIRGLMKLPPNRRCINCNSLGPQYVCTNFWTFVCITCSGIHREFTHRVKSVSMSTFTSQEIESLQNGGNQRAREIFLNDWDPQRQRFPDSSNADKVREFIKNVYVDKKYAGRKTSDKPPRGMQDLKSIEDETRRASSYHSYSQSPPYDYEYEERRYGKQAFALTRKTGSDRGIKTSSFLSPSHSSDNVCEDRFAAEGSHSRASSYSVSSAGDTFRSDTQSPTFQRGIGFSIPFNETSRDILSGDARQHHKVNTYSDTYAKRDTDQIPHSQRTASTSSFGSFNSNSMSFKSVSSENAADVPLEADQSAGTRNNHLATFLSLPHSSSGNTDNLDLLNSPFVSQTVTSSASDPDLFQLPTTSSKSAVDLFQPSSISSLPTVNSHIPSQNFQPSGLDLFSDMPQQQLAPTLDENSSGVAIQKNEGWATFDAPQYIEPKVVQNSIPATMPSNEGGSLKNFDEHLFPETVPQWSTFPYSSSHGHHSSIPDQWHVSRHNNPAILNAGSSQPWSTFENPVGQLPFESVYLQSSEQVTLQNPSSIEDQYLGLLLSEDLKKDGIQIASTDNGLPIFSFQSHEGVSLSVFPLTPNTAGALSHSTDIKSTNPFDTPYDVDLESSNAFLDMSSLQAVLPNGQMHTTFIGGVTEPWFTQNPVTPYIPSGPGPQGGLELLGGPTPNTQITSVLSQGPVATVGGNPFL